MCGLSLSIYFCSTPVSVVTKETKLCFVETPAQNVHGLWYSAQHTFSCKNSSSLTLHPAFMPRLRGAK